ncbi:MAG: hypothetical protein CMN21_01610 [Rubinisphaera sp.]|uniref:hypothetical protein n=1 Tax=Rubinisphaera sp. TaxID=2024857 RepID=UPI000C11CF6A|nr:hypothetical protein [Rubinisphaera sp.]MBV07896.1 hypothetical protein [Rubinisphaera sp.]|tara:strand:- start:12784 stop:13548 length:765 start_codon:yes stop_codon:yes gene_type:complete
MKEREKLIVTGLVVLMLLAWLGFPLHHAHRFAGSLTGGVLGVTGAVLMLVPLAYLIVKRNRYLKQAITKYISMRTLLAWHIYAGVMGPILVILHSGHKYESLLGITLTAMTLLVVLSGFVGRYLMSSIAKEIRDKKAMLSDLQKKYDQAVVAVAANPVAAKRLQPFSNFYRRLISLCFSPQSVSSPSSLQEDSVTLIRLSGSVADMEYAIQSHETFKKWFAKWLKFHIAISFALYALMFSHVYYAVYFGLRWFD